MKITELEIKLAKEQILESRQSGNMYANTARMLNNLLDEALLIHNVSDMFSAEDMRIAFEDGEHYGKGGDALIFDIENYR